MLTLSSIFKANSSVLSWNWKTPLCGTPVLQTGGICSHSQPG